MLSVPVVLQVLIPVVLLVRQVHAHRHSLLAWMLATAGVISYLAAIAVAGLWLSIPWYVAFVYFLILAIGCVWQLADLRVLRWLPVTRIGRVELGLTALFYVIASGLLIYAGQGRRAPPVEALHLSFPLEGGTYYVANGGSRNLVNAHLRTLTDERFRNYRGQSYAVDIVKLGDRDLRATGFRPQDPAAYASFGEPVYSPCGGEVARIREIAPDITPPTADASTFEGNYILINCGGAQVLLGHLERGSLRVQAGDTVMRGQPIAAIGNSGASSEPHLHVHAQRVATDPDHFMAADPLPIKFDGRFLSRNDIVRTGRVDIATTGWTETQILYAELTSAVVALLILLVTLRSAVAGRVLLIALFAWAAVTNMETVRQTPLAYLDYGPMAVSEIYRQFIFGFFALHVAPIVTMIAIGQALVAVLLLLGGRAERVGLIAAIVFLCGIAPLGVYAGFPATLILALAALVVLRDNRVPVFGRLVRATREELARILPGDDLIPAPIGATTHAVTIARPPREVWPWLAQMGADRAGWYSYDLLDNGGHPSATAIVPALQEIEVGTLFSALPGAREAFFVRAFESNRMLTLVVPGPTGLKVSWTFVLEEPAAGVTRLIVRVRFADRPLGLPLAIGVPLMRLVHFIMERKQLLEIAWRVERRPRLRAA
jgi:hypothetical protein